MHAPANPPTTARLSRKPIPLVDRIVGVPPSEIDSEQFSAILQATEQRGESLFWLLAGLSGGVCAVLTWLSHFGPAAVTFAALLIFAAFSRASKTKRQARVVRDLDSFKCVVQDEVLEVANAEHIEKLASVTAALDSALAQAEEWSGEVVSVRGEKERITAEDLKWSAYPSQYIHADRFKLLLNLQARFVTLRMTVRNTFSAQRTVWISGNVSLRRKRQLDGAPPLCSVQFHVFCVDVPPGGMDTEAFSPVPVQIPQEALRALESAYATDGVLEGIFVDLSIVTMVNLTTAPATARLAAYNVPTFTVPVEVFDTNGETP